jgi:hypothetical protein
MFALAMFFYEGVLYSRVGGFRKDLNSYLENDNLSQKEKYIGYLRRLKEEITLSEENLVKFIKKYNHEIPLLINGKKVWIHFIESDKILMECNISDGSGVELNFENL